MAEHTLSDLPVRDIAIRFESLGGGSLDTNGWAFGCEFGFFQRSAGVEPLGLLRWASIGPEGLIRALENGFESIDHLHLLELREHTGWDWGVTQTTYGIRFDHTFLDRATVARVVALHKISRSLTFLKLKLLRDLADADKIFVYRCYDHMLASHTLDRLARAVNAYGPNTLLYVVKHAAAGEPISVEHRRPGLMMGYIDAFAPRDGELVYNDAGWETLCRCALRRLQAARRN